MCWTRDDVSVILWSILVFDMRENHKEGDDFTYREITPCLMIDILLTDAISVWGSMLFFLEAWTDVRRWTCSIVDYLQVSEQLILLQHLSLSITVTNTDLKEVDSATQCHKEEVILSFKPPI